MNNWYITAPIRTIMQTLLIVQGIHFPFLHDIHLSLFIQTGHPPYTSRLTERIVLYDASLLILIPSLELDACTIFPSPI